MEDIPMSESMRVKFIQIAIASATDQDLSDRIYALGQDGNIYLLTLDIRSEWYWSKMPELDINKLNCRKLG
jgi:hypothetical protein